MKANRKAMYNDEQAVSPVIAVILMVAITVVLAATVFVLVNELGQDVGQTGPTLGLTTANANGGGSGSWEVRLSAATATLPIGDYTLVFTNATGSTISGPWADPWSEGTPAYTISHTATGTTGDLSVGDRLTVSGDFSEAGRYTLELIHRPTASSAGSISRSF